MLLAAGLGTRLRPLTNGMPKCLLEVNHKPLLRYHLDRLVALGVKKIVLNLGWYGRKIRHYVERETNYSSIVEYSQEDADAPLETGGGVFKALPLLGRDPFLVVNSDVWTDYPYERLLNRRLAPWMLGYLVLVHPPASRPGDYALRDGKISEPGARDTALTFSGLSILARELFTAHPEVTGRGPRFPLRQLFDLAAGNGSLGGELYDDGEWRDIGTIDSLNQLRVDKGRQPPDNS